MVGPIRVDGLSSGIDYTTIIQKLLSIQKRPITDLQSQATKIGGRKTALQQLSITLLSLKGVADNFAKPSFFAQTKVSSTNETVLKATGSAVSTLGAYSFSVRRLAQAQQLISNGFPDPDTTSVTAGASTLRIELGGGQLERRTPISFLNGGTGIDRGSIKITDTDGKVAVINLEHVVTVQDVVETINANTAIEVEAFVTSDRLTVRDEAAGAGTLRVENFGADTTATTLGLDVGQIDVAGVKHIFGRDINMAVGGTALDLLNDRLGVRRNGNGSTDFTITDTDGVAIAVDLQSGDTTLQSAINRINTSATAAGSSLTAALSPDGMSIVLSDAVGVGGITVAKAADSFAAVDLGFGVIDPVAGGFVQVVAEDAATGIQGVTNNRLFGNRLSPSLNSTHRSLLRGGQTNTAAGELKGVRDGTVTFTDRTGVASTLNLGSRVATTLSGAALAGATSVSVTSAAGFAVGNRFRLQTASGIEERTITSISGTTLTFNQGLTGAAALGNGIYAENESLGEILRNVNDRLSAAGVRISVGIDPEGNGILVTDTSGGSGTLSVVDTAGSVASDLGIAASVSANTINGADVDPQWLSERTLLSSMNGGNGVRAGTFRVIDTDGVQFDVDLTQSDDINLAEVIRDGNSAATASGSGVRFSINDAGDGLLVEDTAPGPGTLRVQELAGGRTARDLRIEGSAPSATPTEIDGSFEIRVDIKAGAKLKDVVDAINTKGIPVQAAVVNDGSPVNPYRISLLSKRTGESGRIVVDSDMAALSFTTSAAAQNSVLLQGSNGGATDPIVLSSSSNTYANVVSGLTLQLLGTSETPVTVTVSRDTATLEQQASKLADSYNAVIKKINELTFFDPKTFEKGPLFADSTVRRVERDLADLITRPVDRIVSGDLNTLSSVGFRITKGGGLTLNTSTFSQALQDKFDQVQTLFTLQRKVEVDTPLKDFNRGLGVKNVEGEDFEIYTRSATRKISIDMSGLETVSSVLSAINNDPANGGAIVASIGADGFRLQLDDTTSTPTRLVEAPTTVNTFVETDADIDPLADDFINGATITFLTGANAGEVRKVSDWVTATNTITLDSNLPFAPAVGDQYRLERELEVRAVGTATSAAEMKIKGKAALGENELEGKIVNLNRDPGAAPRMVERLDLLTRAGDGVISTRTDSLDDTIKEITKSIEKIEKRVEKMQERLVREFARLEVLLAESKSTMGKLQNSLGAFVGMLQSAAAAK